MIKHSAIVVAALFAAAPAAHAQSSYPERPIRMIVPFAPGGGSDISARTMTDAFGAALGTTIVVDNRPGAGSTLGADIASKASPDGYTLFLGNISLAFNAALYKKLPFNAIRDFAPISLVTEQPNIIVTHPSLPARNFQEFIALAKKQPGKLTYGSAGLGSGTHLAMEMLMMSQDIQLIHVPYKGTGPAVTALLGNETNAFMSTFASALPHVKSGRLRGIAVTTRSRSNALPEVPTVQESGVPGFEYATWYGILTQAAVAKPIVEKLNKTIVAVMSTPEMKERYERQGMDATPSSSADFVKHLRAETDKWAKVVRDAKIPQQ
ncbi:MAG: tripartite tricarboxylate transporter substrate binding protein [Burkholderiales bacterium]|jgi:tripartite-type tricarboxylate transporter receptor subunit TctC|nr:tripartite tricarboxylate transporter substrate binding protein [Burkholderiales bacterium]